MSLISTASPLLLGERETETLRSDVAQVTQELMAKLLFKFGPFISLSQSPST